MESSLTYELAECLRMLDRMAEALRRALLERIGQDYPSVEDATMVVSQLTQLLEGMRVSAKGANTPSSAPFLLRFVELNQRMDFIAATGQDEADCPLCEALRLQAEGVRVTMPALLHWCHGGSGTAHEALVVVYSKFQRCLSRLRSEVAA